MASMSLTIARLERSRCELHVHQQERESTHQLLNNVQQHHHNHHMHVKSFHYTKLEVNMVHPMYIIDIFSIIERTVL